MSHSTDREMVVTRTIKAPRELVFEAFTSPEHVGHWWGPNGFTTTTLKMDVRPGGVWRYVMHGPDGIDYQNRINYIEVVKPERLVYEHGGGEGDLEDVTFRSTVTFTEVDGKTTVQMRSLFSTKEERDRVVDQYGALEGGKQHLSRLAGHVETLPALEPVTNREVVSKRLVKASQARVFRAFANPEHLKNWWGPKGFTNTMEHFDFKPGGVWRFVMHGPDGKDYPNESRFEEIVEPARIVLTHLQPMHQFRMTITMKAQGEYTEFGFHMLFDSEEEWQRVQGFVMDANEQNFDRLEAVLEKVSGQ